MEEVGFSQSESLLEDPKELRFRPEKRALLSRCWYHWVECIILGVNGKKIESAAVRIHYCYQGEELMLERRETMNKEGLLTFSLAWQPHAGTHQSQDQWRKEMAKGKEFAVPALTSISKPGMEDWPWGPEAIFNAQHHCKQRKAHYKYLHISN